eukprot:TRINITY_DN1786_c0_g1_i1.p1 TRINITY_DN1786_c0_g1~~TRINITY_DN1786_c0_g1_i1.p1  ORF type:complete len:855 (-),score=177.85 TRINITY_DN1786_c0_g1_i1:66-2630(-)
MLNGIGYFAVLLATTCVVAVVNHNSHDFIFLTNDHIDTNSRAKFYEESHPSKYFQNQSLQERLSDLLTNHLFVVHFDSKDLMHQNVQWLIDLPNSTFIGYVSQGAYILYCSHQTAWQVTINDPAGIDWVGYLRPEHKLHASSLNGNGNKLLRLVIHLAHSVTAQKLENLLMSWNVSLVDTDAAFKRVRVETQDEKSLKKLVEELSHYSEVLHIERARSLKVRNIYSKGIAQTGTETQPNYSTVSSDLKYWMKGLTGANQTIGIGDTGLDYKSCFFADSESATPPTPPFKTWTADPSTSQMINSSDFSRRKIVQYVTYADSSDNEGHGTHVSGSAAGYPANDAQSFYRSYAGAAKGAQIAFFDMQDPSSANLKTPSDLTTGFFNWAYAANARIHSNSWGTDAPDYDSLAMDIDSFTYANKDFLVLVAAGNTGSCAEADATVGTPATAKNCIAVGASLNAASSWSYFANYDTEYAAYKGSVTYNSSSMASFSSQGPTADGRLKPDVAVPGYWIWSASTNQTSSFCSTGNQQNSIVALAGSSMASPTLAGNVAIVRQYLTEGYYPTGTKTASNAFHPSASLLKALVINSAVEILGKKISSGTGCTNGPVQLKSRPSFQQGFGRAQLDQVLYLQSNTTSENLVFIPSVDTSAASTTFNDRSISAGVTHSYSFCAFPGSREIRVTLVWTDPASTLNAQFNLVNDLDLVVTRNGATQINGNTQSGVLSSSNAYLKSTSGLSTSTDRDSINNVESVYLTGISSKTDLTLTVKAVTIASGGSQAYSLVISGNLAQGKCANATAAQPQTQLDGAVTYGTIPSTTTSSGLTSQQKLGIIIAAVGLVVVICAVTFMYKRCRKNKT